MMELVDIDINEDNLDFSQVITMIMIVVTIFMMMMIIITFTSSSRFAKLRPGSRTKEMRDRFDNYSLFSAGETLGEIVVLTISIAVFFVSV